MKKLLLVLSISFLSLYTHAQQSGEDALGKKYDNSQTSNSDDCFKGISYSYTKADAMNGKTQYTLVIKNNYSQVVNLDCAIRVSGDNSFWGRERLQPGESSESRYYLPKGSKTQTNIGHLRFGTLDSGPYEKCDAPIRTKEATHNASNSGGVRD